MKITKNQSLALAVSIIALFFVCGVYFMPQSTTRVPSVEDSHPASLATPLPGSTVPASPSPESKFILKDFERSEIRDGRKEWEAKGSQGQYFPENNSAKILNAKVWVYKKDGQVITLTAGEALLHLQGVGLSAADASKGVVIVYNNQEKLETDSLTYDKNKNLVSAPGFVKITGDSIDISGDELSGNLETKEFVLKRNVSSVLKPKEKKHEN
jgi:LPS export ABC transporter protein LptC